MTRCRTYAALAVLLAAAPVRAQTSLDEIEKPRSSDGAVRLRRLEVGGYVDDRFLYSLVDPALSPLPTLQETLEGNVQLKLHLGARAFAYSDLSLVYQVPGQSMVAPSELYVTGSPRPWLSLLGGRKRTVWGAGFAFNPSDLLDPPKDPTDPTFQRAGAWMARVELPFEKITVTGLFSPEVAYEPNGLPSSVLQQPGDSSHHFLAAARVYLLLLDSDVNLIYYFTNQYGDAFANKSRVAASVSHTFGDYELHFEGLVQQGSANPVPVHACAADPSCDPRGGLALARLDDGRLYLRAIAGGRTSFRDLSFLSFEYYYQGDGYRDSEFADFATLLARAQASGLGAADAATMGALPQRFVFNPLRQHYVIASYTKPRIHDDFTVTATLIAGLSDLSGVFSPSLAWSAREWLLLGVYGFVPFRGEFALQATDFRALFEARAFY